MGSLRERERETWMDGFGEREWRVLMFDMSGPKIERVMERECLHAAHHYRLGKL